MKYVEWLFNKIWYSEGLQLLAILVLPIILVLLWLIIIVARLPKAKHEPNVAEITPPVGNKPQEVNRELKSNEDIRDESIELLKKLRSDSCFYCFYWNPRPFNFLFAPMLEDEEYECRRYAPKPTADELLSSNIWPYTKPSDWCGDFRERVEEYDMGESENVPITKKE